MSDELLDLIRHAGRVAPPPDRDEAFRHAMRAVARRPMRLGVRRVATAIAAAAMLAVPAGVFQAVGRLDRAPDRVAPLVQPAPQTTPRAGDSTDATASKPADTGPGVDPQPSRGADTTHGHKTGDQGGQSQERSNGHSRSPFGLGHHV